MVTVERNEFPLQTGCLKLVVVKVEFNDFLLRKPISEARAQQMQSLGIDVGIVEGMLTGRLDALHLEGQPAAIARRVGEELNVVACGGK